jgi:hypothetical protein
MELLGSVGHLESRFSPFGDGVSVGENRCIVCTKCTIGSKIVLGTPKVLLGDEAQLEAHFGLFGDSANINARLVHGLRQKYQRLRNHFRHTRWNS